MSELSEASQNALSALRDNVASDDQRERMRARLLSAGVAVSVAAAGAAASISATAAASTSAAVASNVVGSAQVASAMSSAAAPVAAAPVVASKLVLSGVAAKLVALPLAIKAAVAVGTVGLALTVPRMLTPKVEHHVEHKDRSMPAAYAATDALMAKPKRVELPSAPIDLSVAAPVAETAPAPVVEPLAEPVVAVRPATPAQRAPRLAGPPPAREPAPAPEITKVASVLAAESALLADALRALRANQLGDARALLDRHQRDFGISALLAPERERMREELSQRERTKNIQN